ncbi:MAG: PfaD family polyunsaturated fatty acid/polyketide biosynthesis protein [Myxococcota bacterium]|nr:PfaD family polyunsaturated fatty acid/polyketide biosynthesis protein [Myxococcota bacterium]
MLDALASYGARTLRVVLPGGVEESSSDGGGLVAAVDGQGMAPIAQFLSLNPEVQAVELEDEGVALRVSRHGSSARIDVRWSGGEHFEDTLDLPAGGVAGSESGLFVPDALVEDPLELIHDPSSEVFVVDTPDGHAFARSGTPGGGAGSFPLVGRLGPTLALGSSGFRERLGVKANYVAGAMAGGIASAELVIAMGKAGYIGFFGAGGLPMEAVRAGVLEIRKALGDDYAQGFNLLHNPVEPQVEEATVDLYLEQGCRVVSASAYMGLSPAVVRFRYTGAYRDGEGRPVCPNTVLAKVSRPEVAEHFLRPPPAKLLEEIAQNGGLSAVELEVAKELPVAEGITCEADSGGHTDHRPLPVILPVIRAQRDRIAEELGWAESGIQVAIGAGGGLGTPESLLAAWTMGADYVLTGSVNQCSVEAGTSELAKTMLLGTGLADVASGAAPDRFEIGAHVQVLSRGSMYARRSQRLYGLYKGWGSWEEIPEADRKKVEKQILCRPFEEVWAECEAYWGQRDPSQVERAQKEGRHKMALVFRWYLGMSSRWARMGEATRKKDFQIWCGPSMGAFNDWVSGTELEPLSARSVVTIADELLRGAAAAYRATHLRMQGVCLPDGAGHYRPAALDPK